MGPVQRLRLDQKTQWDTEPSRTWHPAVAPATPAPTPTPGNGGAQSLEGPGLLGKAWRGDAGEKLVGKNGVQNLALSSCSQPYVTVAGCKEVLMCP